MTTPSSVIPEDFGASQPVSPLPGVAAFPEQMRCGTCRFLGRWQAPNGVVWDLYLDTEHPDHENVAVSPDQVLELGPEDGRLQLDLVRRYPALLAAVDTARTLRHYYGRQAGFRGPLA